LFTEKNLINKDIGKYKKGDIVGCGINFIKRQIFFTVNGIIKGKKK
jgi:hypothetical protein